MDLRLILVAAIFVLVEASVWILLEGLPRWLLTSTVVVGGLAMFSLSAVNWWSDYRHELDLTSLVLGIVYAGLLVYAFAPRPPGRARGTPEGGVEGADKELRRLLGLLLLELYRESNRSPSTSNDFRRAVEYATRATDELKTLRLEAREASLLDALHTFTDRFEDRTRAQSESPRVPRDPGNRAAHAYLKFIYSTTPLREHVERLLLHGLDEPAIGNLLELLEIHVNTFSPEELEILIWLDEQSELHLVDPGDFNIIDMRVMPRNFHFGKKRPVRVQYEDFRLLDPDPDPYWDAGIALKRRGLIVGTNYAPHRPTALGLAIRYMCMKATVRMPPWARARGWPPRIKHVLTGALATSIVIAGAVGVWGLFSSKRRIPTATGVAIRYQGGGSQASGWHVVSDRSHRLNPEQELEIVGEQAAIALQGLDPKALSTCILGHQPRASMNATPVVKVFTITDCMLMPQDCSDGIQNQDETDIDCGGSHCSPCTGGGVCNVQADCYTRCESGRCTFCNGPTTGQCGGACPACPDHQYCKVNTDCASGHCQAWTANCPAFPDVGYCVPATCDNGILDPTEAGIDCGGSCYPNGCPSGTRCSSPCDCLAGHECIAKVCS